MARFSIRELMLVTMVAGLCTAWIIDHQGWLSAVVRENNDLRWKVEGLEWGLREAKCEFEYDELYLHVKGDNFEIHNGSRPEFFARHQSE